MRDIAHRKRGGIVQLLGQTKGRQGVGSLAGLGNRNQQRAGADHKFTVAKFTGHFDTARNTGHTFNPVFGHHARVITGAAGNNLYALHFVKNTGGRAAKTLFQNMIAAQTPLQGIFDDRRLLKNLLEHKVSVVSLLG